jgi:EAL and modified HD-GYP domain-containing signal transduction protein
MNEFATCQQHSAASAPRALIVRQPIFDAALKVVAYELLCQDQEASDRATVLDAIQATAQLVAEATLDIGFRRLVGDAPAFIRFPADLLATPLQLPLAPDRIVIEVVEGPVSVAHLLDGLMRMRSEGYQIALAEFDIRRDSVELLDYADIVKVDIQQYSPPVLEACVRELRRFRLQLVAEKVETAEELARCKQLGFDLLQGNFLHHPETFQSSRAPSSRRAAVELVQSLQECCVSAEQVERRIAQDLGLSYRLLRCVNSSYYRTPRAVGSMRHAILLLGYEELRRICSVILLTSMSDRPAYVTVQALTRARMCETLCTMAGLPGKEGYFMTGLLSLLNVLLGAPLGECSRDLPLSDSIHAALLEGRGSMGSALGCVLGYERGNWDQATFEGLATADIATAYAQAVNWADSMRAALD